MGKFSRKSHPAPTFTPIVLIIAKRSILQILGTFPHFRKRSCTSVVGTVPKSSWTARLWQRPPVRSGITEFPLSPVPTYIIWISFRLNFPRIDFVYEDLSIYYNSINRILCKINKFSNIFKNFAVFVIFF